MYNFKLPNQTILRNLYEQYFPSRVLITRDIETAIEETLKALSSRPTVKGRVKEFESYFKKYLNILKKVSRNAAHPFITDIIGIRVVCPFFEDLAVAKNLLKKSFEIVEEEQKGSNYSFKEFGYESIHLLIKIPEVIMKNRGECGLEVAEVQIRTILQDAWAEVEHELVYKAEFTTFDDPMRRKLAALNASLSLADTIFQEIRNYQRRLNGELGKRRNSFFKKIDEATDALLFASEPSPVSMDEYSDNSEIDNALDRDHSIDNLLLQALYAHNKNQFKEAISFYTYILTMTPDHTISSLIYKHRGMANFARSQYEEAIIDFTKSLEMDPECHKSAYYRGVVRAVLQQYSEAIDDFTLSLKINPYYAFCFYRRGQAYYHIEDLPQALADCESALALEPNFQEIQKFRDVIINKLKM